MYDKWADRVTAVTEEDGRRALVAEIALWRARHLTDVPATREGSWALARLHTLLGERDAAIREAQQLISLCQTPPLATRDEIQEARRLLSDLGEKAPKILVSEERPRRERERARPERDRERERAPKPEARRDDPLAEARDAAALGQTRKVRKLIGDRRGTAWNALRAWSLLVDALDDPSQLKGAAEQAVAELAAIAGIRPPRAPAAEPTAPAGQLAALLGQPLPGKRRAALKVLEDALAAQPQRADALAAAALADFAGEKGSASWLSGVVGLALAQGGEATRARLADLQKAGTASVAMFDALPFHRAVRLATTALASGWALDGLREGVLSRGEPADRRVWTLRLSRADGQRMLAVAPHSSDPWPGSLATEIAQRTAGLSPSAVLLATGIGNAALRDAAHAAGLLALAEDADDTALLEVLAGREPAAARAEAPAPEAREPEPRADGPSPPEQLAELLAGQPTPEAIREVVASFRRPSSALRVAERADASLALAPTLLLAVHEAAGDDRPIPEGTTLAVRAAAAGIDGARALLTEGATAARYGGPGAADVAGVAAALAGEGWELFRVLRGTTRRERDKHPVLDTLGEALDGLWRLLVRKGDVKGEVWFVAELAPEGRAGVPQLLLEEHQRAVVLPIEPELLSWYGSLGGPEAIGWTGAEADALARALGAWTA